jgi:hypothetical protein
MKGPATGTQITFFAGTTVQILPPEELRLEYQMRHASTHQGHTSKAPYTSSLRPHTLVNLLDSYLGRDFKEYNISEIPAAP